MPIPDFIYPFIVAASENKNPLDSLANMTPAAISGAYNRLFAKTDVPKYNFHSLRHYYASMMLANNVPTKYATKRMGHATDDMLKKVYQHIMKEKDDEVTDTINAYFNLAFGQPEK